MTITEDTRASANPTKAFFVRMITRDISLEDCILDLIDNSIDGAWQSEGSRPIGLALDADLSAYTIDIKASPEQFSITDNCGGMSLNDAVEYAFSFGRRPQEKPDEYSIGVYGIGMKRAVFKLGTDIRIRSTYADDDGTRQSFAVPINVEKWLESDDPPWDFDLEEDEELAANGVRIDANVLTSAAASAFSNPAFLQNLSRTIARDYSLHLSQGLSILLNGKKVNGWSIELLASEDYVPVRISYDDKENDDEVSIEIIGGMSAPPPEDSDPEEDDRGDRRDGWYVVCNGRIVLAADKTEVSGWGSVDWPQWHRQYSGFLGIILFSASNAAALPLTTTKRSIDSSSEVYRRARPHMREISKSWIDYTNQKKQSLEEAKAKEAQTKPISIRSIVENKKVTLPRFNAQPVERVANINYSVPLKDLKLLAKEFGRVSMSYRDVGLKSFEYSFDDLVGED